MNKLSYAEVAATSDRLGQSRPGQGMHIVSVHDNEYRQARAPPAGANQPAAGLASFDGEGVNSPSSLEEGPSPEGLRACVEPQPTGKHPAPASREVREDTSWELVRARRRRKDATEKSTGILWGVPGSTDLELLQRLLQSESSTKLPLSWGGKVGDAQSRHVVVQFENSLHKLAMGEKVKSVCEAIGLKLILRTRDQHLVEIATLAQAHLKDARSLNR